MFLECKNAYRSESVKSFGYPGAEFFFYGVSWQIAKKG